MERVKQRIIETIIQINRTHTLPAYGMLLVGPAGTGKSQIAYAVARILKLPWTTLDMSSINDPEQLLSLIHIYEPSAAARAMKAKSSGVVGVILADTSEGYCARALKGIEEAASALEYQIVVGNSGLAFQHEKD